jgi:hypothetical protein
VTIMTPGGNLIPPYAGRKTSGVLRLPGNLEIQIQSGYDGPSRGTMGIPGMHNRIKSHVEAHAAVIMRRSGVNEATLYLNRVPCPSTNPASPGCYDGLPRMLPYGSKLKVVGPDGFDEIFVGIPDPPNTVIVGL